MNNTCLSIDITIANHYSGKVKIDRHFIVKYYKLLNDKFHRISILNRMSNQFFIFDDTQILLRKDRILNKLGIWGESFDVKSKEYIKKKFEDKIKFIDKNSLESRIYASSALLDHYLRTEDTFELRAVQINPDFPQYPYLMEHYTESEYKKIFYIYKISELKEVKWNSFEYDLFKKLRP